MVPRAFSSKPIEKEKLMTLFEAQDGHLHVITNSHGCFYMQQKRGLKDFQKYSCRTKSGLGK